MRRTAKHYNRVPLLAIRQGNESHHEYELSQIFGIQPYRLVTVKLSILAAGPAPIEAPSFKTSRLLQAFGDSGE